jgi:phage-related protein
MPVLAYNGGVAKKREQPRKLIWLVDSLVRLAGFPPTVRHKLGFALYQAQIGQKHERAKMLHGFSETVWQVRADDPGGTYRAVRFTQSQAAAVLGIDQPKVSALTQGKLSGFSIERLMRFLLVLGRDIEITVKGRSRPGSPSRRLNV